MSRPRQTPYKRRYASGRFVWVARYYDENGKARYAKPAWNRRKSSFACGGKLNERLTTRFWIEKSANARGGGTVPLTRKSQDGWAGLGVRQRLIGVAAGHRHVDASVSALLRLSDKLSEAREYRVDEAL